jgi:acyl-CoA thioesterase
VSTIDESRALRNAAAVEPVSPGRFTVQLSEFYTAAGHPNGGYLQCVMANAAIAAASAEGATHLHATAVATNYIGAPEVGAAELWTDVRRVGRGVSFVHVTLVQDGAVTTESLVTLGTLRDDSHARYTDAVVPEVAPVEECRQSTGSEEVNIMRVVDLRLDPSCAQWWSGEVSSNGEVRGWLRLSDGDASWDAWSALFASDAMPPATFPLGSSGWVPTLQLTSYVRRIPVGEWLRARQWCVVIADGLVDERCELFDERGEIVASSSQLAMVRFPGGR